MEFSHPFTSRTDKVTLYTPAPLYVMVGFCELPVFPFPKSQTQLLMVPFPADEASLKTTGNGIHPDTGAAVKLATGLEKTVINAVCVLVLLPDAFVTLSETVYVPGKT